MGVLASFLPARLPARRSGQPGQGARIGADPDSPYERYRSAEFEIVIAKDFIDTRPDDALTALKILTEQIDAAAERLPPASLRRLADVKFWIEADRTGDSWSQSARPALYIPHQYGIVGGGKYAVKAGSIEVPVESFLNERTAADVKHCAMFWALHELAHAYHERVLGWDHGGVRRAYQKAKGEHLYDRVATLFPLGNGRYEKRMAPAYAATNECEYLAELSVLYLARNSTFPNTRSHLRHYDPDGYALMVEVWGR